MSVFGMTQKTAMDRARFLADARNETYLVIEQQGDYGYIIPRLLHPGDRIVATFEPTQKGDNDDSLQTMA